MNREDLQDILSVFPLIKLSADEGGDPKVLHSYLLEILIQK